MIFLDTFLVLRRLINSCNSGVTFFRLLCLGLACFFCPAFFKRSKKFLARLDFLSRVREGRVSSPLDELAIDESIWRILDIPNAWEGETD